MNAAVTQPHIINREHLENGVLLNCLVPEDLYYFQGHFPKTPVLAGVVQLSWVRQALMDHTGLPGDLVALEAVKFHKLLLPGQNFSLKVTQLAKGAKWAYTITSGTEKVASGRMVLSEAPA